MGKTLKKKIQTRNPIILQLHLGICHWGLMVCKISIHAENALTFTVPMLQQGPGGSVVEHPVREREVVG